MRFEIPPSFQIHPENKIHPILHSDELPLQRELFYLVAFSRACLVCCECSYEKARWCPRVGRRTGVVEWWWERNDLWPELTGTNGLNGVPTCAQHVPARNIISPLINTKSVLPYWVGRLSVKYLSFIPYKKHKTLGRNGPDRPDRTLNPAEIYYMIIM